MVAHRYERYPVPFSISLPGCDGGGISRQARIMPSFTGMLPRYTLGPGHDKGRKGGKVLLEDERCGIMSFVEVREGSTKLGSTKAPIYILLDVSHPRKLRNLRGLSFFRPGPNFSFYP